MKSEKRPFEEEDSTSSSSSEESSNVDLELPRPKRPRVTGSEMSRKPASPSRSLTAKAVPTAVDRVPDVRRRRPPVYPWCLIKREKNVVITLSFSQCVVKPIVRSWSDNGKCDLSDDEDTDDDDDSSGNSSDDEFSSDSSDDDADGTWATGPWQRP